mmetsp:Transcript_38105/g.151202  ORF Transcript_38105/g.151202 Transcript_38105/m.151202 type:complete len:231 (-) Transcript_38105:988-1680(-)|eukprot:CAMPEP_0113965238 /NCGR_PEP_ID=MMETSP0011_2-20120614/7630_1 /TAXON_ID=101924 /ORGANISM="Rhodosorus marinus" /LENGTH=230 /DNA_ID=CAMNT_0000977721 /DNA_START=733 /DNA_END=1425 /DNA_ORIENTATION=- /assembly_acc=CAM_ASM_000156
MRPGFISSLSMRVDSPELGRYSKKKRIELVSAKPCPYAQRAWIALEEVGVEYTLREVELYGGRKPDWFLKVNPKGQVPVLLVYDEGDNQLQPIIGSNVICRYIADNLRTEASELANPEEAKDWHEWIDDDLGYHGKELVTKSRRGGSVLGGQLATRLLKVEEALRNGGPFVCGSEFSTVDVSLYPFLSRLEETFSLEEAHFPHLLTYIRLLKSRRSIQRASTQGGWWWWW